MSVEAAPVVVEEDPFTAAFDKITDDEAVAVKAAEAPVAETPPAVTPPVETPAKPVVETPPELHLPPRHPQLKHHQLRHLRLSLPLQPARKMTTCWHALPTSCRKINRLRLLQKLPRLKLRLICTHRMKRHLLLTIKKTGRMWRALKP